jgi:hypothetical protein
VATDDLRSRHANRAAAVPRLPAAEAREVCAICGCMRLSAILIRVNHYGSTIVNSSTHYCDLSLAARFIHYLLSLGLKAGKVR